MTAPIWPGKGRKHLRLAQLRLGAGDRRLRRLHLRLGHGDVLGGGAGQQLVQSGLGAGDLGERRPAAASASAAAAFSAAATWAAPASMAAAATPNCSAVGPCAVTSAWACATSSPDVACCKTSDCGMRTDSRVALDQVVGRLGIGHCRLGLGDQRARGQPFGGGGVAGDFGVLRLRHAHLRLRRVDADCTSSIWLPGHGDLGPGNFHRGLGGGDVGGGGAGPQLGQRSLGLG